MHENKSAFNIITHRANVVLDGSYNIFYDSFISK